MNTQEPTTEELKARYEELRKDKPTFDKVEIWDEIFALETELVNRGEHAYLGYGKQADDWR